MESAGRVVRTGEWAAGSAAPGCGGADHGRAPSTAQGLRTPSVFAPAPLGAQHARTDIGAVHSLQRGVDGLLILGERTGSQQRNDLNISLPSHCCPTPCIQASITLTLEAVTVAHQRGFWRRGRPVAILGGRAHQVCRAQPGHSRRRRGSVGHGARWRRCAAWCRSSRRQGPRGATQEPGGADEPGPLAQVRPEAADRDTCADHQGVGADPACAVPDRAELPASQTRTKRMIGRPA